MSKTKKAFTLTELLTVMAIIGLLIGISMPALSAAKKKARETVCRATIMSMETSLENFRSSHGFYPSSKPGVRNATTELDNNPTPALNTGAHKLAEALVGYDTLGYQKDHYYAVNASGQPVDAKGQITTRSSAMGLDNIGLKKLSDVRSAVSGLAAPSGANQISCWDNQNYVMTDGLKADSSLPFLYYKANSRENLIGNIFNYDDNAAITDLLSVSNPIRSVWNVQDYTNAYLNAEIPANSKTFKTNFYYYLWDTKTANGSFLPTNQAFMRPCKKDTFLIISAGSDQIYGTADDIANVDLTSGK